ncbi:glycosyltransferase family 2 protein [Candidatus Aminicenantes bacterium AC-334-K16]|jgi:hypothetical protein|nr:glycosyltransferase family 2 protein [Candidatus Aminicenantes bacterium AC-334-K16]
MTEHINFEKSNQLTLKENDNLAIIILNWNGGENTKFCLKSLKKSEPVFSSIIIVDNGSTDNSLPIIYSTAQELFSCRKIKTQKVVNMDVDGDKLSFKVVYLKGTISLFLILLDDNYGIPKGRNIGIEWALKNLPVNYLFLLDNDAQVEYSTLSLCLKALKKKQAHLVGCVIKNEDNTIQFAGKNFVENIFYIDILLKKIFYKTNKAYWDVDMLSGCFMAERSTLELIKKNRGYIFDSKFFLYCEDQDLSLYAKRKLNLRNIILRDSIIYHKISAGNAGLPRAYYYSTRNRIYLANSYLPLHLKILFHLFYSPYRILRALIYLTSGNPKLARGNFKGLIDGYRGVKDKCSLTF